MTHKATPRFWDAYDRLPRDVRRLADEVFGFMKADPRHPSVHLKKVGPLWSARVGAHSRALAVEEANTLAWFWIGRHDEYERLIRGR
ncbi:MAG TPA: hypothetical protein VFE05_07240 [Longimicrobiaceae bacterium]|nr:hypothetical protein [Longimicrobiaceae bacterium]